MDCFEGACTLERDELPRRLREFARMFAKLGRREREGVWVFAWSAEVEREVRALAAKEQACCSFWTFTFERTGDELRWEAHVPPGFEHALATLDALAV